MRGFGRVFYVVGSASLSKMSVLVPMEGGLRFECGEMVLVRVADAKKSG